MEFLVTPPKTIPKTTFECLSVISVGSAGLAARRASAVATEGEDSPLARVLSGGGRRKSSFGVTGGGGGNPPVSSPTAHEGSWYWRSRVGVTDEYLVILPVSEPPNPILKQRPHHPSEHSNGKANNGGIMHAIRRASAGLIHKPEVPAPPVIHHPDSAIAEDEEDDNNHETAWPAVIHGQPLQAIIIPLSKITTETIHMSNKKDYNVSALIANAHAGRNGHVRFEFPTGWIGAKGEAELLLNKLQMFSGYAQPVKPGASTTLKQNWQEDFRGHW